MNNNEARAKLATIASLYGNSIDIPAVRGAESGGSAHALPHIIADSDNVYGVIIGGKISGSDSSLDDSWRTSIGRTLQFAFS